MKNRCLVVAWCLTAPIGLAASCAKIESNTGGSGGRSGTPGTGGTKPMVSVPTPCPGNVCTDLPAEPIVVDPDGPAVPANPGAMFPGTPPAGGTLCIEEPEPDTLFPNNWLRPRIKFDNPNGELTQIRMRAANQTNELVAYTMSNTWKLPKAIWDGLRTHQFSDPVTVTIWRRSGAVGETRFSTAPVAAGGKMVFWAANPSQVGKDLDKLNPQFTMQGDTRLDADSELLGFAVGDESTVPVLKISQVKQLSRDNNANTAPVRCIGCHVATPDGAYVAFNEGWPWRMAIASVANMQAGAINPNVSVGGYQDMLTNGLGMSAFSKAHWATGDRIMITTYGRGPACDANPTNDVYNCIASDVATKNPKPRLAWFDLESAAAPWEDPNTMRNPRPVLGTNFGIIARDGDTRGAASPTWSTNGTSIVYSSTAGALDGRLDGADPARPGATGDTDLWQVPYNNKAGGTATPLRGGDLANRWEYYAAFSPDDKFVAFTSVPAGEKMYANPHAELFVVKADGSTATPIKLNANRPKSCSGKVSPGINNHWPRWSPSIQPGLNGITYYWLIFSSNRADIPAGTSSCCIQGQTCAPNATPCYNGYQKAPIPISQLYITGIGVGESGTVEINTPAIYLWNQPATSLNTTPAWENFQIPMVE